MFVSEPLLCSVVRDRKPISARAGDYFSTASFNYDDARGFGSNVAASSQRATSRRFGQVHRASVRDGIASAIVPIRSLQRQRL
jgi:hypothetical protein